MFWKRITFGVNPYSTSQLNHPSLQGSMPEQLFKSFHRGTLSLSTPSPGVKMQKWAIQLSIKSWLFCKLTSNTHLGSVTINDTPYKNRLPFLFSLLNSVFLSQQHFPPCTDHRSQEMCPKLPPMSLQDSQFCQLKETSNLLPYKSNLQKPTSKGTVLVISPALSQRDTTLQSLIGI